MKLNIVPPSSLSRQPPTFLNVLLLVLILPFSSSSESLADASNYGSTGITDSSKRNIQVEQQETWSSISSAPNDHSARGDVSLEEDSNPSFLEVEYLSTEDKLNAHSNTENENNSMEEPPSSLSSLRKVVPPIIQNKDQNLDEESDASVSWWPWNRNKTQAPTSPIVPTFTPTMAPTTTPDNTTISCNLREKCEDCIGRCHWCAFDNQCHAIGSMYGCKFGTSCDAPPKPKPVDPVDNSCHSHLSCTECTLSSNLCHWCAFDDQCHAIGSMYGCVHATNCYSNDRCQREVPETIDTEIFSDIGFIPIILIFAIGSCAFCCTSVVFGGVKALKGAYDDLAAARLPPTETVNAPPMGAFTQQRIPGVSAGTSTGSVSNLDAQIQDSEMSNDSNDGQEQDGDVIEGGDNGDHELLSTEDDDNALTESLLEANSNSDHATVTAYPDPSRLPPRRVESHHMNCLIKSCRTWYYLSIAGLALFVSGSIYFFPKVPMYNVCSDEFAWKSIIDGLTSLKMEASFELLVSVENKNHLNISLEGFGGKFKHDGEDVGTFTVPQNAAIGANSITDILITCTVVPNKWEALGLISDYYKGNLVFLVDVNGAVKITGINYSFPVKETDVLVRVNDPNMDDRHLCACPEWKDLTPTKAPKFMKEIVSYPSGTSIF